MNYSTYELKVLGHKQRHESMRENYWKERVRERQKRTCMGPNKEKSMDGCRQK